MWTSTSKGRTSRYRIDRDETIKGIENVFADYRRRGPSYGFFKSASDICERFLYPAGDTNAGVVKWDVDENGIRAFWKKNTLTGDNLRERPYAELLPRLTTKSNTYTVHFRVQTVRQPRHVDAVDYRRWKETPGAMTGEFRGSTTIERYLDPDDRRFDKQHATTARDGDFLDVDKATLEPAYRFRIVTAKRFLP
jgi:hypothetical protein